MRICYLFTPFRCSLSSYRLAYYTRSSAPAITLPLFHCFCTAKLPICSMPTYLPSGQARSGRRRNGRQSPYTSPEWRSPGIMPAVVAVRARRGSAVDVYRQPGWWWAIYATCVNDRIILPTGNTNQTSSIRRLQSRCSKVSPFRQRTKIMRRDAKPARAVLWAARRYQFMVGDCTPPFVSPIPPSTYGQPASTSIQLIEILHTRMQNDTSAIPSWGAECDDLNSSSAHCDIAWPTHAGSTSLLPFRAKQLLDPSSLIPRASIPPYPPTLCQFLWISTNLPKPLR